MDIRVEFRHTPLDGDGAADSIDDAGKLQQQAIAGDVGEPPAVVRDESVNQFVSMSPQRAQGVFLIDTGKARKADHICRGDCRQSPFFPFRNGASLSLPPNRRNS